MITAFNFPVAVWSWNAAIASVCGDPVVWKPSSYTPLAAHRRPHLANRVMADHGRQGLFNLVIGTGREVGDLLLERPAGAADLLHRLDRRSAGVSSESVARRFGRTILELGGNNAIIVAEDANLDLAARAILFGAVGTAGQRCTSTRRIIAQRTICRRALATGWSRPTARSASAIRSTRHADGAAGRRRRPSRR